MLSLVVAATSTPFNEHKMVMVHDAATTYLDPGIVNNWAKTQDSGGFAALLSCGARAIDFRPAVVDGELIMHHGSVHVKHSVSDALDEVVAWATVNATVAQEMVVLLTGHFYGDGCATAVAAAYALRMRSTLSGRDVSA